MFFEFEKKSNPEKNKKLDDQEVLQMLRKKGVENETNAEPGDGEPDGLDYNVFVKDINLEDIEDAEQTQLRECHSDAVIKELKRLITATREANCCDKAVTARIPDITVVKKPKSKGKFWIIDGHHRYLAAKAAGVIKLSVQIADPKIIKVADLDELHFLQARENATTQANRTTETKFKAVEAVLKKHHHWNNNQIARYCTVSSSIVEVVRSRMIASGKIPKHEKPQEKAAAAVADPENAKKSNRELAKELGVGEATVRRVRQNSKNNLDAFPACLKCGKALDPKRRKGLTYTDEKGEKVKFCCRECVQAYAREKELILDESKHILSEKPRKKEEPKDEPADVPVVDADSAALDKVSSRAHDWLENHEPQDRPTLNKVTEETRRVVPEVEKPKTFRPGGIPLRDTQNIEQVVKDVYSWLGDRAETFSILFSEYLESKKNE